MQQRQCGSRASMMAERFECAAGIDGSGFIVLVLQVALGHLDHITAALGNDEAPLRTQRRLLALCVGPGREHLHILPGCQDD